MTRPENRLFYPALDGLRALALLMVFAEHYLVLPWGYTGVDLFFVLSGFLITGILFDTRDRKDRVRSFFIRRALRIFPLYYGVLLVLLLLTPVAHLHWSGYWLVYPGYLVNILRFVHPYSQDPAFLRAADGLVVFGDGSTTLLLGHFWSLSLEEQFYLGWPWVVFWVRDRRRLVWICAAVGMAMPFLRMVTMATLPRRFTEMDLPYSFTPLRLDALLLGGLLALLLRGDARESVLRGARWFLVIGGLIAVAYVALTVRRESPYGYPTWRLTWGQSVVDLLFAALIATALQADTVIYRVFSMAPLRWLGRISYGLYIFHDIPRGIYVRWAEQVGRHWPVLANHISSTSLGIAFPCTVLVAWLSFRYVETPFLNLKERLAPG